MRVVIRTFEPSRKSREFGKLSDLLDSFRKLCETTLDHPSLARPLAFGANEDVPYLVYSDLAGTAMDAAMRQDGPRSVAEVLQRTTQLAEAIDFAASAGVHHGTMAPCDVILDDERTGVTGFGLAQALIKVGIAAEAESPYGSPQRLAGAPPTHADDIYSLAAITLELLIGTPHDPDQEREAQGLPARRHVSRPAPHETRVFTTIAGVDAGKLRASFAAAFCEEPRERPSTAAEFVASLQEAFSNRRVTDDPAPSAVVVPFVSEERKDPPSAPALHAKPADDESNSPAAGSRRSRRNRRRQARRQQTQPMNQPLVRESDENEPRERKPEIRVIRLEPIVDDALLADVTPPPRARSIDAASYGIRARSGSRALPVALVVAVSLTTGFGGGFVVGQRSRPSTESTDVSHHESVAEPQPTRAAVVEEPKRIASTTPTPAPVLEEKASTSEPIAATAAPQPAVPAVASGRLLIRSAPAGAGVMVDGQSRGVTPLTLRELAFGAHAIEISHPGHGTRKQRVTLSERRPTRSVDFKLRPTSSPARPTTATNSTGALQVASNPSGAQVFVDDNLIGTTPLLLSNVAAGSRRLRIELSGYKTWTTSIQIEPSARFRLSANLEP